MKLYCWWLLAIRKLYCYVDYHNKAHSSVPLALAPVLGEPVLTCLNHIINFRRWRYVHCVPGNSPGAFCCNSPAITCSPDLLPHNVTMCADSKTFQSLWNKNKVHWFFFLMKGHIFYSRLSFYQSEPSNTHGKVSF